MWFIAFWSSVFRVFRSSFSVRWGRRGVVCARFIALCFSSVSLSSCRLSVWRRVARALGGRGRGWSSCWRVCSIVFFSVGSWGFSFCILAGSFCRFFFIVEASDFRVGVGACS